MLMPLIGETRRAEHHTDKNKTAPEELARQGTIKKEIKVLQN